MLFMVGAQVVDEADGNRFRIITTTIHGILFSASPNRQYVVKVTLSCLLPTEVNIKAITVRITTFALGSHRKWRWTS